MNNVLIHGNRILMTEQSFLPGIILYRSLYYVDRLIWFYGDFETVDYTVGYEQLDDENLKAFYILADTILYSKGEVKEPNGNKYYKMKKLYDEKGFEQKKNEGIIKDYNIEYIKIQIDNGENINVHSNVQIEYVDIKSNLYVSKGKVNLKFQKNVPYKQILDYISSLAENGEIDDYTYMVYKKLFNRFIVGEYEFNIEDISGSYSGKVYVIVDFIEKKKEDKKEIDLNEILFKEWVDGFFNIGELVLRTKSGQSTSVSIGQLYDVEFQGEKFKLPGIYGPSIRAAMLMHIMPKRFIEQAKKTGKLYTLQTFQYRVLQQRGHENVLASVRRSGKTFLSAYLMVRELLSQNVRGQPKRILYYGLSRDRNRTVINYVRGLTKAFQDASLFKYIGSENTLVFRDGSGDDLGYIEFHSVGETEPGVGEYADLIVLDEAARIPYEVYDNMISIITSEGAQAFITSTIHWDTPKNWFYQKLLEAEREVVRQDINTYYEKVRGVARRVSEWYNNLSQKQAKKKFEDNLIDIKEELFFYRFEYKYYATWRVTLDEVERIPEYKKQKTIEKLLANPLRYYTEVHCIYPSRSNVFDYQLYVKHINWEEEKDKYIEYFIGYDPAKESDLAGIVVVGVYFDEKGVKKYDVIEERFFEPPKHEKTILQKLYFKQAETLIELKNKYSQGLKNKRVQVVMDARGVGSAVGEILQNQGLKIDFYIKYTNTKQLKPEYKDGFWSVNKVSMVETLAEMFQLGLININSKNKKLIEELEHFTEYTTPSGNKTYQADSGYTDDLVNAMMMAIYTPYKILGYAKDSIKVISDGNRQLQNKLEQSDFNYIEYLRQKMKSRDRNLADFYRYYALYPY